MLTQKQVNLALLIGTGQIGEDVLHKLPWIKNLDKDIKVNIASRINPNIHLNKFLKNIVDEKYYSFTYNALNEIMVNYNTKFIYNSEYFSKKYTIKELVELEYWLGISFSYISSFDRRFYNKDDMRDIRDCGELNNYLAGLIEFFRDFFRENKIDFFINTVEDDLFSVVAYYTAMKLDIDIIGLIGSRFPNKGIFFCKNFRDPYFFNKNNTKLNAIKSLYDKDTIVGKDTVVENTSYWSFKSFFSNIFDLNYYQNYNRLVNYIVKQYDYEKFILKDLKLFSTLKRFLLKFSRQYTIKRFLKNPDFNDKYFLFPLHYTEDAQITFREPLIDQVKLIHDISRTLPKGSYLYVKPHPHHIGTDVNSADLAKISKIENVKVIDPSHPPIDLLIKSKGVITINSTSGFEALIMDVPVITFGHDFYCREELCTVIRDTNDLSKSLMDLLSNNYEIERIKVEDFVKETYNNTIMIDLDHPEWNTYNHLILSDNDGKKIAEALNTILKG